MNEPQYCKCEASGGTGFVCSICHKTVTFDEPLTTQTGEITKEVPSQTQPTERGEMLKKIKCLIFGHTVKKAKVTGLPSCFEWTVTCDCGEKMSYFSPRCRLYGTEITRGWKP